MQRPPKNSRPTPRFPTRSDESSRNEFDRLPHLLLPRYFSLGADHLIRYIRVLRVRSTESFRGEVLCDKYQNHLANNLSSTNLR